MNAAALLSEVLKERIEEKKGENMTEKTCSKCGKKKPIDQFYRQSSSKDGHHSWCKRCHNLYTGAKKTAKKPDPPLIIPKKKPAMTLQSQELVEIEKPGVIETVKPVMITCSKCGAEKEATLENFHSNSSKATGLDSMCKVCRNKHKAIRRGSSENSIILDFSDHPDVLGKVQQWAKDNMRDPAAQILFSLKYDVLAKRKVG